MLKFFSNFSNLGVIILFVGFIFINLNQQKQITDLKTQIENDSIFYTYDLSDPSKGLDTTVQVKKADVFLTLVNYGKEITQIKGATIELVNFSNWSVPVSNSLIERFKPVGEDGILCSSFTDWLEDQKALAEEKAEQEKVQANGAK